MSGTDATTEDESGAVFVGLGTASTVRIPVPGQPDLFIELSPRSWNRPSTSTLFIQDTTGKRQLRLDYGYNARTGHVDYHWNHNGRGIPKQFGVTQHQALGKGGGGLYQFAKYYRAAGRIFVVLGVAVDIHAIAVSERKLRTVTTTLAGWGGAWAGGKGLGAACAWVGTLIEPGLGTAIGGLVCGIAGGVGGYYGASWAAGEAYDFVEERFERVEPATVTLSREGPSVEPAPRGKE